MPAELPETSADLLRLVERSGLISFPKISQEASQNQAPTPALAFAKSLVQKGLLTTFQADQLMQGKSKGFFLGNYQVLEPLGNGGTAGVFLCEHKVMRTRAAVKVLCQARLNQDANILHRFRREARATAALSHPNVVRTIDFGEHEGRHFLVMEYVDGLTLDQWLIQNPNPPLKAIVSIILQAAIGLQHVHEAGLIHRDIKPANLLLDKHGTLKILDLGLAKFIDESFQDGVTEMSPATIVGTVDFMSPEQANCTRELDIRGDIYGLGATLYYLATGGNVPFPAPSVGAKMIAIQFQQVKPIREFRPDADSLLEKIVERMMAREPEKRFQTPKEAIAVLQGWLGRGKKKSRPVKALTESVQSVANRDETAAATPTAVMSTVRKAPPVKRPSLKNSLTKSGRVKPIVPRIGPARNAAPKPNSTGPVAPPAKAPSLLSEKIRRWSLRTGVCLLVLGAIVMFKPWQIGQRSTNQALTASK